VTRAGLPLPAALLLAAAGCAIAPPSPAPDPLPSAALREEGRVTLAAHPAEAAFCVSQAVEPSLVELVQDGAAVRPAAGRGAVSAAGPDYALVLTHAGPDAVAWRLLVAPGGAAAPEAVALRLRRAFAACLGRLGRST
jgi:hypothetical protein